MADLDTAVDSSGSPPLARSPIPTLSPSIVVDGWEVTDRSTEAALRLADLTPLAKVHVRADENGAVQHALGVGFQQAVRDDHGVLITGSGPGEWLLIGTIGSAGDIAARVRQLEADERPTVVDLTHGRALLRLTGDASRELLTTVCALDLQEQVTPNGTCLRSSVAKVVTDLVRDDRDGQRSYLLHCERSSGAYLAEQLQEVGRRHGLEIEGFLSATQEAGSMDQ